MRVEGRIAGLFVHPVKGCRGTSLEEAVLEQRGLRHDRRWTVVTPEGRFLTQRELPALARVVPRLEAERLVLEVEAPARGRSNEPDRGCGVAREPGTDATARGAVPVTDEGERLRVRVWHDEVDAGCPSPQADALLSGLLGREARLVRFPEAAVRACDPTFAPEGAHTGFADAFPLLVTTEASLVELNEALMERGEEPVPMARFRPNIVVAGVPARAEDRHAWIEIAGRVRLALVKPCDRCVVTTTDQTTGERLGEEPLRTLGRIRRNPATGGVWFGQNAVPLLPDEASAVLRVGTACRFVPASAARGARLSEHEL